MYEPAEKILENTKVSRESIEILQEMIDKQIFGLEQIEGDWYINEECDAYYRTMLTVEMCDSLARLFNEMKKEIASK